MDSTLNDNAWKRRFPVFQRKISLPTWLKAPQGRISLSKPKEIFCFLLSIAALSYAGAVIPGRLSISPSNSVGHRVFYYKPHFEASELKEGTYVLFDIYTKLRPNCWPCTVVKQIGCTQGMTLTSSQRHFYCNGKYIGTAKSFAKDGTPLKAYDFNGKIPAGKFFAAGACIDSYDSRYIGFVDEKKVKAIAIPIF
jgi:type IV secretory pathway protease TraF